MVYNIKYILYLCFMKKIDRFLILSRRQNDVIREYDYAYYWEDGYEYVDARFLYLGKSKEISLSHIELFSYKLMYINPNITHYEINGIISNIIDSKIENGTPVYVRDEDVLNKIKLAEANIKHNHNNILSDISRIVRLQSPYQIKNGFIPNNRKHIEFKKDLSGLLVLEEDEEKEYLKISDTQLKSDYIFNLKKKKKAKYAMEIFNKHRTNKTKQLISNAIEALSEQKTLITREEVSELTGFSERTISRYINKVLNDYNKFSDVKITINKKEREVVNNKMKLKEHYEKMVKAGGKINKSELHRRSKVSRVTINKYWDNLKM